MQHLIFFYVICGLCIVWLFFAINDRIRMFIIFTNNCIDMRCYFQYVYCDSVCYWNFVFSLILAICGFYLKQIKRCISVDLSKVIPFWKYGIAIFFFSSGTSTLLICWRCPTDFKICGPVSSIYLFQRNISKFHFYSYN